MRLDSLFTYDSVALNEAGDGVVILDQTLLPGEERFITLRDEGAVYEAIAKLRVRGAPAIGVAAAYGLYVSLLWPLHTDCMSRCSIRTGLCLSVAVSLSRNFTG